MAAPSYVTASTGATDATGPWSHTSAAPGAAGRILLVHLVQDGTNATRPSITSVTNAENLAGTDNVLTYIGEFAIGNPTAAFQHLWIGRSLSTSAMVITGTNVGGDDVYMRVYEFSDVSTGTTLATVIENGTAGTANNEATTIAVLGPLSDCAVTTLGTDRLALNFQACDDDNGLANFTGMTGGTWALSASYAEASGTDAALALNTATMASAGTINGGQAANYAPDNYGVVGFALIGTTPAAPIVQSQGFANHAATAVL